MRTEMKGLTNHAGHHTFGRLNDMSIEQRTSESGCELTMRSKVQVGLAASGVVNTQLSSASPKLDPPHIKIWTGSV